jgi:hypothetical protein
VLELGVGGRRRSLLVVRVALDGLLVSRDEARQLSVADRGRDMRPSARADNRRGDNRRVGQDKDPRRHGEAFPWEHLPLPCSCLAPVLLQALLEPVPHLCVEAASLARGRLDQPPPQLVRDSQEVPVDVPPHGPGDPITGGTPRTSPRYHRPDGGYQRREGGILEA